MWFTNAITFAFTKPFNMSVEDLGDALNEFLFQACGSQQPKRIGWTPPMPGTTNLVHAVDGNFLICLKTQEKLLPSYVINEELADKLALIENERGQKVGKKERQVLKEEIILQLLPKAFVRNSLAYAYIDVTSQRIVVNCSSSTKAEELLAMLRQSIGTLPILPMLSGQNLLQSMTDWAVNGVGPSKFSLGSNIRLQALDEDAAKANLQNHDVTEDEVQLHISNGKFVNEIQLNWNDKITFSLTDTGLIKKVKFLDIVKEQTDDVPSDDRLAKLDADYAIMSGELNYLITDLSTLAGTDEADGENAAMATSFPKEEQAQLPLDDDTSGPFYEEAKVFVIETRKASVSSIQRKLRIGYNRAARIVEALEKDGVVSSPLHNGAREVLIPSEVA